MELLTVTSNIFLKHAIENFIFPSHDSFEIRNTK